MRIYFRGEVTRSRRQNVFYQARRLSNVSEAGMSPLEWLLFLFSVCLLLRFSSNFLLLALQRDASIFFPLSLMFVEIHLSVDGIVF